MSRIGKKAIDIPDNVKANIANGIITVTGPKGELSASLFDDVDVQINDNSISVVPKTLDKKARSFWGLTRTLINNLVAGVSEGFMKTLEIQGVGYRAQMSGKDLVLNMGYSHPVTMSPPEGLLIKVESPTSVVVSGMRKDMVGEFAAKIRSVRPPEPYKGKGIRYSDEIVIKKEAKKK